MILKTKIPVLLLILLTGLKAFAQETFDKAMEAFLNNDRKKAIELFEQSIQNVEKTDKSHLALCMIYSMEENPDLVFEHFRKFVSETDNPYPYIIALWNSEDMGMKGDRENKSQLLFLNHLIQDSYAPHQLKSMCHKALGDYYFSVGDQKKATKHYSHLQTIDIWSCVGPFENFSGSGFDKGWSVLDNSDSNYLFKGKHGALITWFETYGPHIDLDQFFDASEAIFYSQSFVRSPLKQKVQLHLAGSGSFKLWLNDQLLLSETEERNTNFDAYTIETFLEKGDNRILIQTGKSETDIANFILRITDENGLAIKDLRANAFSSDYIKEKLEFSLLPNYEEDYFKNLAKKDASFLNRIVLASAYIRNDKKYPARKLLKGLLQEAPNCSFLKLKMVEIHTRESNKEALGSIIEWLKKNDPENSLSINLIFNDALSHSNHALADSFLNIYKNKYGLKPNYYHYALALATAKGENEKIVLLAEEAYLSYPDIESFVILKSGIETGINKNSTKNIKLLKKQLTKRYNYEVYITLANAYSSMGDTAACMNVYTQLIRDLPYRINTYSTLSSIYYELHQYASALTYINLCIQKAPYKSTYWKSKGKILQHMELSSEAVEAYQRAVELSPNDYDAKEKIRLINNKKSVFNLFDTQDYFALYKKSPDKDKYPDDNSLIITHESQTVVYEDGGAEQKFILMIKLFNSAGIEDWKEYRIPHSNSQSLHIETAEVIKTDSSRTPAQKNNDKLIFPDLKPGDAILLIYTLKNYYPGKLVYHFWDKHLFISDIPCLKNSYSLLVSPQVKFSYRFSNGGFDPIKKDADNFDLYTWTKKDIAASKVEKYMSPYVDFSEALFISSFPDWNYISNWYADIALSKAEADIEVKEQVAQLLLGHELDSDREKAEIIYNFIIKNIEYRSDQGELSPQKASSTLSKRYGNAKDISTLFVSMCRETGIEDARPVLISKRNNGTKDMMLPSISFDHCMARVNINETDYYAAFGSEYCPFLSYNDSLLQSFALGIYQENGKANTFYFNPSNRRKNTAVIKSRLSFYTNELVLQSQANKTGICGAGMRYVYKDKSEEEQRKIMLSYLENNYKNFNLDTLFFKDFDSLTNDFNYSYRLRIKKGISKIAGLSIFNIPWSEGYQSMLPIGKTTRKHPFELWQFLNYDRTFEQIELLIPEGTTLAEQPKNISLENEFAKYKLSFEFIGNTITVSREFIPLTDVVMPEDFDRFKKFMKKVVEYDTQNYAFK